MKEKEIKINVPDGYEVDKENSTFECIKFKSIKKKLPKTWKEFCATYPRKEGEIWIGPISNIQTVKDTKDSPRDPNEDRNLLPNIKYAEAMLALCQLIQLRDCYNDDWVPDWTNDSIKHIIYVNKYQLLSDTRRNISCILTFKTRELRDKFLNNFRGLIEVAKPLL